MTCWCFFSVLPRPWQPQPAPTSHNDSLVLFFCFSLDYSSHNKHQQVVATRWCFFHFFLDHAGHNQHQQVIKTHWCFIFASPSTTAATISTNELLWLVGAIFCFYLDHAGHNEHQWVLRTCWCYFLLLPQPCRPQPAPMSRYDLLVLFFASTLTMQATMSTSESLWLAGAIFPFFDDHSGHHTLILTWCGTTTSPHPMTMIISHLFFFLLVFYFILFLYYSFTSTSSMNYNVNLS